MEATLARIGPQATRAALLRLPPSTPDLLRLAAGARVHCVAGILWITEEGCHDDVVLSAGQHYVARGRGPLVLHAMRATAIARLEPAER